MKVQLPPAHTRHSHSSGRGHGQPHLRHRVNDTNCSLPKCDPSSHCQLPEPRQGCDIPLPAPCHWHSLGKRCLSQAELPKGSQSPPLPSEAYWGMIKGSPILSSLQVGMPKH